MNSASVHALWEIDYEDLHRNENVRRIHFFFSWSRQFFFLQFSVYKLHSQIIISDFFITAHQENAQVLGFYNELILSEDMLIRYGEKLPSKGDLSQ
jgi:hypothetical protein